jgi:ADP-ribosylglycohydrolase
VFREALRRWGKKDLEVGYGKHFKAFIENPDSNNYASIGNGAAMRTAAIGYLSTSASYLTMAREAARVSHSNPEAIRGALAVTDAVAQSRKIGATKESVKLYLERVYYYDLGRTLTAIRPTYKFESAAVKSVPEAIIAFLESTSQMSAIENAISLGGDTDTQAMIAGCIADAFYGYSSIPLKVHHLIEDALPLEMMHILEKFEKKFIL